MDTADTFTCEGCAETFLKGWSDEQSRAEYEQNFPLEAAAGESTSYVCTPCFEDFKQNFPFM